MEDTLLCLTGTIVPNSTWVARSAMHERVSDYASAIGFYLSHTSYPLLFAENSDYDLEADPLLRPLMEHPRLRVQRIPAHSNTSRGKGFQEFYMLDRVFDTLDANTFVIKCSGRYIVKNALSLTGKMQGPLHIDLHRQKRVAITSFFGVKAGMYNRHIRGLYANADDDRGYFIEHVLYDAITNGPLRDMARLLPENPKMEGVSGSGGQSLARNRYKMMARSAERRMLQLCGINEFMIEY